MDRTDKILVAGLALALYAAIALVIVHHEKIQWWIGQ